MINRLKTFKAKILAGMLLIVALSGTIAAYTIFVFYKKAKLETIQDLAHELHTNTYKSVSLGQNFLLFETINSRFFENKNSPFLKEQEKVNIEIIAQLDEIIKINGKNEYLSSKNLTDLKKYIDEYKMLWSEIVVSVIKKGFKDYGLEGEMRQYIHQIEDNQMIAKDELLTLRRYEKDYMLRKDLYYLQKLQSYTLELISTINSSKTLDGAKKNETIQLLTKYYTCFNSIAEYDKKIGFNNTKGLISRFRTNIELIEGLTSSISYEASTVKAAGTAQLYWIYGGVLLLFFIVSLLVANLLATTISRPLVAINKSVEELVQKEFPNKLPTAAIKDESEQLITNLKNLIVELKSRS